MRKVNRIFHDTWLGRPPRLGSPFHFRQSETPAYVLTDLQRNIILSNWRDERDDAQPKRWVITGFRSHVTRLWAASTAVVMATVHLPDLGEQPPPLPEPLKLEAEVQLWAGYTEAPRPVRPDDLCVRLLPVFTGVVETITGTLTGNGGYTLMLQLRDRMKWFLDSVVTYQPGVDNTEPGTRQFSLELQDTRMPNRSMILIEIARRAIGHMEGKRSCVVCGKRIEVGRVIDVAVNGPAPADAFADLLGHERRCPQPSANPYMNVHTTRNYRLNGTAGRGFSIDNRVAVEMMRFLAMSEVYPTELFQDHRDGNFYYTPRFNILTGYQSPAYFYRTYYVKNYPDGVEPDINQMALSFKEELSSVGLRTNIIVGRMGSSSFDTLDLDWLVHLHAQPDPSRVAQDYACKFFEVRDDDLHNVAEAALVALQLARIHSKDLRAALLVVLGDPSFVPGEVVQVVGSPLWGEATLDPELLLREREQFEARNALYNLYLVQAAGDAARMRNAGRGVRSGDSYTILAQSGMVAEDTPVTPRTQGQVNGAAIVCERNLARMGVEPRTLWRVEAVLQRANMGGSKGYVTELLLDQLF